MNTGPQNKADELLSKINAKFETLATNLDSKQTEYEIKNYLRFAGQFYNYSFRNQMLMAEEAMRRGVIVECMASFKKWNELKNEAGERASVKKGEKGFYILVPVEYKLYELENNTYKLDRNNEKIPKLDEYGKHAKGIGFKAGSVFDVNQTTAKEIGAYKVLDYRTKLNIDNSLLDLLTDAISQKFSVEVLHESTLSGAKGLYNYDKKLIVVDPSYTTAERISTLYHELGHHLMHGDKLRAGEIEYGRLHNIRGALEGEAEAFSYILSSISGIENKSELYIKTWGNDAKDLKERFDFITSKAKAAIETLSLDELLQKDTSHDIQPHEYESIKPETQNSCTQEKR